MNGHPLHRPAIVPLTRITCIKKEGLMQPDRTYQVIAHHGITFDISEFTVQPGEHCQLRKLALTFVHKGHYQIVEAVAQLYDRMLAGNLPCQMKVAVSRPLTRQQGDVLNDQRSDVLTLVGAAVGKAAGTPVVGIAGTMAAGLVASAAGFAASRLAKGAIPPFHAGDVLVSLQAQVNGGIGPQRSALLLIL